VCRWCFAVLMSVVHAAEKSVCQSRVVTGIKIYSCYLQNLEEIQC
jgi:hypothetical protein